MAMENKRWQDWVNVLLGLWLSISPWVLGYRVEAPNAMWNALILGVAIFAFALIAVNMPRVWEEWVNLILGLWMIISPWVVRFSSHRSAATNAVIVGIIVALLALGAMLRDPGFEKWRRDRSHA